MPHLIEKAFKKSCLLKPKYLFTTTGERGIFPAFLNTFQISLCLFLVETGTIPEEIWGNSLTMILMPTKEGAVYKDVGINADYSIHVFILWKVNEKQGIQSVLEMVLQMIFLKYCSWNIYRRIYH